MLYKWRKLIFWRKLLALLFFPNWLGFQLELLDFGWHSNPDTECCLQTLPFESFVRFSTIISDPLSRRIIMLSSYRGITKWLEMCSGIWIAELFSFPRPLRGKLRKHFVFLAFYVLYNTPGAQQIALLTRFRNKFDSMRATNVSMLVAVVRYNFTRCGKFVSMYRKLYPGSSNIYASKTWENYVRKLSQSSISWQRAEKALNNVIRVD